MKKLTILLLILAILPFASAGQIKHKFVATDESGGQLLYVDETNPENDWTIPLPGNRDIQLSKKGTVLVTVDDGYHEYALKDGKLVKEVKVGKGVRSLVRLDIGNTILASKI
jgi:outer membrane protein assembly factor BamB